MIVAACAAAQLFLSPMGEPFRAPGDAADPAATWFARADADRDGRLALAEFLADAEGWFGRLDTDRDGEIAPAEVARYEAEDAPEIRLYQPARRGPRGDRPSAAERRRFADYDGLIGAGRWSWLNIPQPVASADLDLNRGVSRDEWRQVAARRFQLLGGPLTLPVLKPTPARAARLACEADAAKRRR